MYGFPSLIAEQRRIFTARRNPLGRVAAVLVAAAGLSLAAAFFLTYP